MPWAAGDAERHHKGLSAQDKAKWARIANAVLARCRKTRANAATDCEAMAVRIANSKVGKDV